MATFYIQLKEKLLKISGDLTHDNIVKALGYTPSDFSGNFNDLSDNPFTQNEDGKFNITDEEGNIIATVDEEGIHSIDFIAGEHKLTDKIDATALNGLAKETWVTEYVTKTVTEGKVDLTGYATEEYVDNKDFYDIKNNPIINGEEGNLIFVDESGNIGLKLDKDNNLTVKDVIAGDHILSNKVDKESGKGLSTEDFTTALKTKLQSLSNYDDTTITNAINTLREDFDTLVSGDTTTAIKTFNEIIAFLNGVEDTESLEGIIASIEQQIANIDIPSLDGYATEEYVDNKDFYDIKNNPITDAEDGNFIFVDETGNIGLKLDKDNNLTVVDVIAGEHILSNKADKSDLEGLATESYVITKVAEAKLEGSDITIPVQNVRVNGQSVVKDMVAEIDLTPYAKSEDVPSIDGLATEQYVDEKFTNVDIPSLDGYATEQWVTDKGYLTEHQDISHLATKEELDTKDFYEIHNNPIVNDGDGKLVFVDESGNIGLQLEADNTLHVKDVVAGEHMLSNKADKSEIPSLDGYAKESYVNTKFNSIEIPSLDGYVKEENLPNFNEFAKTEDIPNLDGYVQSSELPDFNEFAKTSDIPSTEGFATEEFVTSQGYLKEVPSDYITETELNSKDYATKSELNEIDFNTINNTPFTNDENGELNIVDEQGNVGLKLDSECLYVKDVIAGEHILSQKVGISDLEGYATTEYVNEQLDNVNNITEDVVSGWGFTKNQGTYSKPSGGIPKTDLASTIQTSLGKADDAALGLKINGSIITRKDDNGCIDIGEVAKTITINGNRINPDAAGNINLETISGGGSNSEANVQAIDTNEVVDDINISYATTAYVDTLVRNINNTIGDINSLLESIINGGKNKMINQGSIESISSLEYYLTFDLPVNSDINVSCGSLNFTVTAGNSHADEPYTADVDEPIDTTLPIIVTPTEDDLYIYDVKFI